MLHVRIIATRVTLVGVTIDLCLHGFRFGCWNVLEGLHKFVLVLFVSRTKLEIL